MPSVSEEIATFKRAIYELQLEHKRAVECFDFDKAADIQKEIEKLLFYIKNLKNN